MIHDKSSRNRQFIATGLAALLLTTGCTQDNAITTAGSTAVISAQQDLNQISQWWNGDYNNDKQLSELTKAGKPIWRADDSGKPGHIEVTSHYRPIDLPAFGDYVLYVEETKHGDPNNIFRQRIYTLRVDEKTNDVRVKLWYFNDKEKYVGAWRDMSRLSDLTPDMMFPLPDECDLIAQKQADKYHMPMAEKACIFGENYFSYQVVLGRDSFWFRDRISRISDDKIISEAGNYSYHKLDKK